MSRDDQPNRRERAQQLRRAEAARVRRRRVASYVLGGVVVAGAAAVVVVAGQHHPAPHEVLPAPVPLGALVREEPLRVLANTSGIPGVVVYDTRYGQGTGDTNPNRHVPGQVAYSVTPPVAGPHNAVWMNCGTYDAPVPNERAVHDLEHGAVWITYRPSLPAAQVAALRALAARQTTVGSTGNRYVALSPWASDALPAPVVICAWGRQLRVSSATDPRLQQFVDAFRVRQGVTPELGVVVDGQPTDLGGRPLAG